jgi:Rps23 Pro-64 3,4-dihydroxylase Tpa1-like proline 4-hydroxylase
VYLNSEWKEGHGGELRVYPFPHESIDVPPLNDR